MSEPLYYVKDLLNIKSTERTFITLSWFKASGDLEINLRSNVIAIEVVSSAWKRIPLILSKISVDFEDGTSSPMISCNASKKFLGFSALIPHRLVILFSRNFTRFLQPYKIQHEKLIEKTNIKSHKELRNESATCTFKPEVCGRAQYLKTLSVAWPKNVVYGKRQQRLYITAIIIKLLHFYILRREAYQMVQRQAKYNLYKIHISHTVMLISLRYWNKEPLTWCIKRHAFVLHERFAWIATRSRESIGRHYVKLWEVMDKPNGVRLLAYNQHKYCFSRTS